jgi:hypothetical protein
MVGTGYPYIIRTCIVRCFTFPFLRIGKICRLAAPGLDRLATALALAFEIVSLCRTWKPISNLAVKETYDSVLSLRLLSPFDRKILRLETCFRSFPQRKSKEMAAEFALRLCAAEDPQLCDETHFDGRQP